jgi:peroxiredoxin
MSATRFRPSRSLLFGISLLLLAVPFVLLTTQILANVRNSKPVGPRTLSTGMPAPPFTKTAQDDRTFSLSNYRGRAVFVAFVPTWDAPETVQQLRSLAKAIHEFDQAGAKVLAVSADSPQKARAVHAQERLPFPLLHDPDNALARQYTVPDGYRTTFVVDPAGNIKFRVGASIIEPTRHGRQLLEISKCCMDEVTAARASGVNKPLGDYSLPRADSGTMETIFGEGTQKATVVLFLSVACPCSNSYNNRVRELSQEFGTKGVRFVGIYSNVDEKPQRIAAHAKEHGFVFPVLKDEQALGAAHFQASITPEVFVVDAKRTLRYAGYIDDNRDPAQVKRHDLRDALNALLENRPVPAATRAFGCGIVRPNTGL